MAVATILWRRLETPGHDACRLTPVATGWQLSGTGVFILDGRPAHLSYQLDCDAAWRTRAGAIRGWIGADPVDIRVELGEDGVWTQNGVAQAHLEGYVDLDLGFTPATNLSQIRRIALDVGQGADVTVAWLDLPAATLERLDQRYERRSATSYWYESPQFAYAAMLETGPAGFIHRYPELWEVEAFSADGPLSEAG